MKRTLQFLLLILFLSWSGNIFSQAPVKPAAVNPFGEDGQFLNPPPGANYGSGNRNAGVYDALIAGADRLVAMQYTDGAWGWPLNAPPTYGNILGPIAMGLAQAYAYTLDADHHDALDLAGDYLLTKTNTFSPSDGYLAAKLDEIFGGTTYVTHLNTNFYGPLAAGTYDKNGLGTLYDTEDYVNLIRISRQNQGIPNLAAWDVGMGLVGAASCGVTGTELDFWIDGTKAEINELNEMVDYDVVGLAGALYSLAFVDEEFDPTAGPHAAASDLADLADILASYQINMGGFAWNSQYVIPNDGNETIQETGYAILALNSVDRSGYIENIYGAADYLISVQLASGGWENYPTDGENNEVTGEALWGLAAAYLQVHNVTQDLYYVAIQDAIDEAEAGDVIEVAPGVFTEQLFITTNNLTIEGAGKSSTFIKSPAALTNYFTSSENNYPVVYVNGVANFTLKNLTVDGDGKGNGNYRFTGIGFYNAGGTVLNVDVKNIWETPFSGNQHGNGVYSFSDAGGPYTIACKNMVIENYQKNGMALLGNAVLDIDNVTTIGEGATAVTAQNGIQAGPLTTGLIKNCDVRDDQYTGGYWTASGIILDGDVDVQNTDITGCQTSIYAIDGDNDLSNLDITAPLVYLEEAYGIIVYSTPAARSGSELPQPSPFDGLGNGAGQATNMTFNLTQSKLTGNYETGSVGVYLFSENGLTATITKCNINNWDYGIYAEGYGSGTVTATVNKCNLSGNNYGFVNVPAGSREDADGTDNWWGDDSGPYNPATNPGGLGSEVSDLIDYQNWITDPVDINIFNNKCGVLEVMAVPSMPLNGQVTNILFAVKWTGASYPDVFQAIQSDYNINLQYYATDGAFKYAVFGTDLTAINWQALVGDTILTLTLKQNQPEGTTGDFEIGDDAWTAANNADYYFEFWGSDLTGVITGFADDVYLASCDLQLHLKAFLQGPYNTTTNLMNVDLTVNGPIPLSQPFEGAPWNYDGTETLLSLPADMVDWVLVELRPTPAGTPIRQAGLLFKDGTVRSHLNPAVDIYFTDEFMPNADYYAALFHRNHMPVMSAAAVNVPNADDRYDFSNMTLYPAYGGATAQVLLESGVHGLITGDVNKDGDLIYSGASNDRALILQRIVLETGNSYINGVTQGYYDEDLTMNSWVKYSGSGNDQRLIILNLIDLTGTYNLNATYMSLVPGYGAKALHLSPGTGPLNIALEESAYELRVVMMTRDYIAEGWTDNIQFTLSWDEKNTRMDQVVKNTASAYGLAPQGEVAIQDGRRYQVFAMVDWFALPQPFVPGEKVTLLSLDKGSFSGTDMKAAIAGDAFTRLHNGEYYVSLAGFDQTGQVLDALTGIGDPNPARAAFSLYPNPASRGFVNLSFMPAADETVVVTVTDLSSRVVAQESFGVSKGQAVVRQISLDGLSKGIYLLRLQGSDFSKTGKLEVQ